MKDKRKILLGTKDVLPQVNKDLYINLEIYNSADELQTEIINNDFNLKEQFNKERRQSLKFCLYGTMDSIYSDLENLELSIRTNHEDLLYLPRIESGAQVSTEAKVFAKSLSHESGLSKNIFKKKKSSFYFMFELPPGIKSYGETKVLIVDIKDSKKNVYAILEIPFLFFDSDNNLVEFGTDTVDLDLNGNEQVIENDYPFLYDTHWIKRGFNIPRPLYISFMRSEKDRLNNLTIKESGGVVNFVIGLDSPSTYGIETVEVFIKESDAVENPNKDFNFEPQKITWKKGEQYKTVSIDLIDDLYAEMDEKLTFGLRDVEYALESEENTFQLLIQNDDIPSPVGFEGVDAEIYSNDGILKTYLTTTNAIKVPNQTVDIVLDLENSDVNVGEEIENTGTPENPEYRQTIELNQGLDIFEIEINIKDNFKYDFDKVAIFKLENPTQNVIVPENIGQLDVTIKDSMIVRHTRYVLESSPLKGQGVFRLKSPAPENPENAISFISTTQGSPQFTNHIVTPNFRYTIDVVNDGESVIFNDRMILSGETVTSIDFRNGYTPLNVNLPSNDKLNEKKMFFEKSKYKFVISNISKSSTFPEAFDLGSSANLDNSTNTYSDVEIKSQQLNSSIEKGGITYYLTSELFGVRTRMKLMPGIESIKLEAYNLILNEDIKVDDSYSQIQSKLKLSGNFLLSGMFGGVSNQQDMPKVNLMTNAIITFFENNPDLEPPKPYRSTNSIQEEIINCKINGTLILNDKLATPTPETNVDNGVFSQIISSAFGESQTVESTTKVLNIKFEEEPVVYSQEERFNETNLTLMPVEPFL
tara:strand:- start:590 stop:3034 length:2445 start_codon:yes stop_codon:yes gene_type:complete